MRATEFTQLSELNKSTLGSYVKANVQDRMNRATGDSFKSGQAGDAYNKADSGHKDHRREQGMDRAVNKLTKESLRSGEYHIHTVYLKNGDVRKFKDLGGESSIKDFYAKRGEEVDHIDYDFSINSGHFSSPDPAGDANARNQATNAAISRFDRRTPESTVSEEQFCEVCGGSLSEAGKASRALCKSSRSNADLGVSQLASCKSQGLRARETPKKHTIGNKHQSIKGKMVKGHKYGGPLPYNKSDN